MSVNTTRKLHIILSGGEATRLGHLSKGVSKALMPLGNTTLLRRQVQQSLEAGNSQILVATSKHFYNQTRESLNDYPKVEVIFKTNGENGPLSALNNILRKVDPKTLVVLTLGDIYFRVSPFYKLKTEVNNKQIYLAAAKAFYMKDLALGGVLFTDGSKVTSIVKKAIPKNKDGYKWSGMAMFRAGIENDLNDFLKTDKCEIEDFFEHCRSIGYETKFVKISDFVNVNNVEDLHVASLYNLAELYKGQLRKNFTESANRIRKESIKN